MPARQLILLLIGTLLSSCWFFFAGAGLAASAKSDLPVAWGLASAALVVGGAAVLWKASLSQNLQPTAPQTGSGSSPHRRPKRWQAIVAKSPVSAVFYFGVTNGIQLFSGKPLMPFFPGIFFALALLLLFDVTGLALKQIFLRVRSRHSLHSR